MHCPKEISEVVLEILQMGILSARAASWEGDRKRAEAELDHIHNLPDLLNAYSRQKLDFYWNVERSCYQQLVDSSLNDELANLWARLGPLVEKELHNGATL
jgi:hypothetical protein